MFGPQILFGSPQLTVGRGVDFDDPEYGFKEEDKDEGKVSYIHAFLLDTLIGY